MNISFKFISYILFSLTFIIMFVFVVNRIYFFSFPFYELSYYQKKEKQNINYFHEGMKQNENQMIVILLGDSTIDNVNYVENKNDSIPFLLRQINKREKEKNKSFVIFAQDNAIIQDCFKQWDKAYQHLVQYIKEKKEKYILVNQICIVISIGGNNLLQLIQEDGLQSNQAFNKLPSLLQEYDSLFKKISQDVEQIDIMPAQSYDAFFSSFVICNLYYPKSIFFLPFYDLIREWNERLYMMSKKWSTRDDHVIYFQYDKFMKSDNDFTHEIEPSQEGGKKFISQLMKVL